MQESSIHDAHEAEVREAESRDEQSWQSSLRAAEVSAQVQQAHADHLKARARLLDAVALTIELAPFWTLVATAITVTRRLVRRR